METFNRACNYVSQAAFTTKTFSEFKLSKLVYKDIRTEYGLLGRVAQLVAKKTAQAYKLIKGQERTYTKKLALYQTRLAEWKSLSPTDQKTKRQPREPRPPKIRNFRLLGGIILDRQTFTYIKKTGLISIWTPEGRIQVPFKVRPGVDVSKLSSMKEAKLLFKNGKFILHQVIEVAEAPIKPVTDFLGVDLGVKNIAYDSDNSGYAGAHLNNLRKRHLRLRAKLQKKQTKSAKRLLKKRSKKETRFASDVNHQISKKLVLKAQVSNRGLAIENLKGIRKVAEKGSKKSKAQRQSLNSWAFFQLRAFITYKCQLYGVDLRVVDPSYTSVTCPQCGCRNKKNRLTRDRFRCFVCSHTGYSDLIAASNIRAKALGVTAGLNGFQPHASDSHSLGATVTSKAT
jgi:IS605 OrfB family transposase